MWLFFIAATQVTLRNQFFSITLFVYYPLYSVLISRNGTDLKPIQ